MNPAWELQVNDALDTLAGQPERQAAVFGRLQRLADTQERVAAREAQNAAWRDRAWFGSRP